MRSQGWKDQSGDGRLGAELNCMARFVNSETSQAWEKLF